MTDLQRIGVALVSLGLVLLGVAAYGASRVPSARGEGGQGFLAWLWEQLQSIITDLVAPDKRWFERIAALGKLCLLVGLAFIFGPMILGGETNPPSGNPLPDSTADSSA
jgi:hypothetical protein